MRVGIWMTAGLRWIAPVLLLVFATACESGPAGPGTLSIEVTAPVQLGAAQVRVEGPGITAIRGLGGSEVASRLVPTSDTDDAYRVVAFASEGGPIRIGVEVESTDATLEVVALDAAGLDGIRVNLT